MNKFTILFWVPIFLVPLQIDARHLRKVAETSEFADYTLVNDSLLIAPDHELLIPYSESGESICVFEQEIVPVEIAEDQKGFLKTGAALIIKGNDKPVLEIAGPRIHRTQNVASLFIRSSLQGVDDKIERPIVVR
ncbi:MAG: hypothetical protein WEB89_01975 [Balneolales bacterium]